MARDLAADMEKGGGGQAAWDGPWISGASAVAGERRKLVNEGGSGGGGGGGGGGGAVAGGGLKAVRGKSKVSKKKKQRQQAAAAAMRADPGPSPYDLVTADAAATAMIPGHRLGDPR